MELFERAAVFGDLHLGKHGDSSRHNQDCEDFVDWFCEEAVRRKADCIIDLGDIFDNRLRLRTDTLDAGRRIFRKLLGTGAQVITLVGNHSMYLRNSRAIHSLSPFTEWDGLTVIENPTVIDGVGFLPYLVGSEYLEAAEMNCKYVFGHLELPLFLTNQVVEHPDRGGLHMDHFTKPERVFTGHFHKRQLKVNKHGVPVQYIGSPFGHNFNDVGDFERGAMFLEWGGEPEFVNWEPGPVYVRVPVSELWQQISDGNLHEHVRSSATVEIIDDLGLEMEEAELVRTEAAEFVRDVRPFAGNAGLSVSEGQVDAGEDDGKDTDQLVVEHIMKIDPKDSGIKPEKLVGIFKGS